MLRYGARAPFHLREEKRHLLLWTLTHSKQRNSLNVPFDRQQRRARSYLSAYASNTPHFLRSLHPLHQPVRGAFERAMRIDGIVVVTSKDLLPVFSIDALAVAQQHFTNLVFIN